jgi:hypothetical protein
MFRTLMPRALGAATFVLAATLAAQPARPAGSDSSMGAYLAMSESQAPFRRAADQFVAAAAAGDAARLAAMISPRMRERAGDDAVRRVIATEVVPFFADFQEVGRSVTTANTTDQFGHRGFVYYLYAVPRGGGEQRPFVLYVVAEGGEPVIANVLVGRLVEGRHR